MPSLKSIRKRIASVKNTRKITRAMKLVAAAKLRRAQDAIVAARPYSAALAQVVGDLAGVAGEESHPLFEQRPAQRVAIVMMSADRGLAGAFNSSVIRRVEQLAEQELAGATEVSLRIIGRKANQHFVRRNANISSFDLSPTSANALTLTRETATRIIDDFVEKRVDRVYLVYNEFKSAISQSVVVKQVLPVQPEVAAPTSPDIVRETQGGGVDYLYEPGKEELLARLVPLYVQIGLYRAALETIAGFFGAQMSAMENATNNAGEMISKLTLVYNRARQAAITKELLEVISGAESLKG
jgi:F-type H+-transporting ATPase subunit gamma